MRQFLLAITLLPGLAFAQAHVASSPASGASAPNPDQPETVRTISIRPSQDTLYPADLVTSGLQGVALVRVTLDPAGLPIDAAIEKTSRSTRLDELASAVSRKLSYKAREGSPQPAVVLVPVEFLRDSVTTLGKKSCAEFNTDAAYFSTTFPEVDVQEMKVINMATGLLFMAQVSASKDAKFAFTKSLKTAIPKAVAECSSRPDAGFLATFKQAIRDSGG